MGHVYFFTAVSRALSQEIYILSHSPKTLQERVLQMKKLKFRVLAHLLMVTQLSRGRAKFQSSSDWAFEFLLSPCILLFLTGTHLLIYSFLLARHTVSPTSVYILKMYVYVY